MIKTMNNNTRINTTRLSARLLQSFMYCFTCLFFAISLNIHNAAADEKPLVEISDHWVRASHPGQSVGAAYMTLTSKEDVTLTHASASVTKAVEVHEMKMVNNIMKMRQLESLKLPKGEAVSLKPGGLHLMLFDLAQPLKAGETVSFELCFADKEGNITIVPLTSTVKAAGHHHHH